jgi:hypothetical protein
MPSPFDALDAVVQTAMDATFGEDIRIEPMATGNYAFAPDPVRLACTARAVVSRAPQTAATNFPSTNRKSAQLAAGPTEAWLAAAALAGLGYALRKGDVIALTEDAGEPRYTITAVFITDQGDARLLLASLTAADE